MTVPPDRRERVRWEGDRSLADRYAALRHPALQAVAVESDDADGGAVWLRALPRAGRPAAAGERQPAPDVMQAAGEIALGLAALHAAGLAHGPIDRDEIRRADDHSWLAGLAHPAAGGEAGTDLLELTRAVDRLLPASPPDAVTDLLRRGGQAGNSPDALAAWGRSALALAAGLRRGNPVVAAPPTHPAADPTPSDETDEATASARRRTRNRMLLVVVLVVIAGALLLRHLDAHGIIRVPNEVGRPASTAVTALTRLGLKPVVRPSGATGKVLAQSPGAGSQVRPGHTVTLRAAPAPPTGVPSSDRTSHGG